MKKTLIILIAVAALGLLGLRADGKDEGKVATNTTGSSSSMMSSGSNNKMMSSMHLKDGTFNGAAEQIPFGTVQVAAVISGGKLVDIKFLQMPYDLGHSQEVTSIASPQLKAMAINNQSANIDFVSGATDTSSAFKDSLQAALDQAAA